MIKLWEGEFRDFGDQEKVLKKWHVAIKYYHYRYGLQIIRSFIGILIMSINFVHKSMITSQMYFQHYNDYIDYHFVTNNDIFIHFYAFTLPNICFPVFSSCVGHQPSALCFFPVLLFYLRWLLQIGSNPVYFSESCSVEFSLLPLHFFISYYGTA